MPICVNPKCGQISKTMSLYCPNCGQKTLSRIDRGQVDGPHTSEISMENFDRITSDVPAPRERPSAARAKSKRRVRSSKSFSLPKFRLPSNLRGRKAFWVAALVLLMGLYVVAESNPSFFPKGINNALSEIKRTIVQILPKSEAYQLGFDEGSKIRNIEVASKAINDHFESYGQPIFPGISVAEQVKNCEETVTIDPEKCADFIVKQNSIEYRREIYQKYAENLWKPMGLLNFLENTEKNKSDFVSGFMTGLFG